jgi:hypothetical protein
MFGLPDDDVDDSIAHRTEQHARAKDLPLPSVQRQVSPRKETGPDREAGCDRRCRGRIPATALARARTVLKVIVDRVARQGTRVGATAPIDTCPVNGGVRRVDRPSWAERQVRSVDENVFVGRIREHVRRDKCLTKVVREEGTPGLGPSRRAAVQIPRDRSF